MPLSGAMGTRTMRPPLAPTSIASPTTSSTRSMLEISESGIWLVVPLRCVRTWRSVTIAMSVPSRLTELS